MAQDRTDVQRAQRGDRSAFLDVYERHAPASWRLAVVVGRDLQVAQGAVTEAFAQVLGSPGRREVNRPSTATQLLRAARESAIDGSSRAETSPDLSGLSAKADGDTVRAFDRLPERWRSVLWLREVEQLDLATSAAVLGMTEQSTDQLTTRALGGLREQFSQTQLSTALPPNCRRTTIRLSGYVADTLPEQDTVRVRRHLDRCEACRVRLDEVDDLAPRLRPIVPVLPLAIEALAVQAWLARASEAAGPFGLRLPNGQLVPAWVERGLAGATAAVVTLGITTAVLLGAKDNATPARIDSADTSPDGEEALVGSPSGDAAIGATNTLVAPPPSSLDDPAESTGSLGPLDTLVLPGPASATPRGTEPSGGSAAPATPSNPPVAPPTAPSNPISPTSPPPTNQPVSDPVGDVIDVLDGVVDSTCATLGLCGASDSESEPLLPGIPGL